MAIIQGVTPATVSQVTPYTLDVDKIASGITSRQKQADDIRDMIGTARASLLKETRDNPDDMALAQELEKGFKGEVDRMVDVAEKDYSQLTKDQIQNLAADWMGKTDWRVLTEAKRNQDEANKIKQQIESQQGTVSYFGDPKYNPLTASLYEQDGGFRKFTGKWGMEKTLNHSDAAKKLFDGIGSSLSGKEWFKNDPNFTQLGKKQLSDGTFVPDWVAYWEKHGDKTSDNWKQVDIIIKGALDQFLKGPEGNQYYRLQQEEAKYKLGMNDEEADKYARKKVQDLIFTYGESEKIDTQDHKVTRQVIARNTDEAFRPTGSKGKGGTGSPETGPTPTPTDISATVSNKGLPSDTKSVVETYTESTTDNIQLLNVVEVTDQNKGDIDNIKNPNVLAASVTLVNNPEPDSNGNTPNTNKGYIYQLYTGDDQKLNPTAIHFKASTGSNDLNNSTPSNYNKYEVENGKLILSIPSEDGKKIDKEPISVEELVDRVGDDLFTADDMKSVLNGWSDKDDKPIKGVESNDPGIQWAKNNSKDATSVSLSTYQVNPETGEADISPVLLKMQEYYKYKLDGDLTPQEEILYQAKLKKVNQKINKAQEFKEDNKDEFDNIKIQASAINERNKMLRSNIILSGRNNNIPDEITLSLIGETDDKTGSERFNSNVKKSKQAAFTTLGIYKSIDPEQFNNSNYSEEDNHKYKTLTESIIESYKRKLLNGEYNIEELKAEGVGVGERFGRLTIGRNQIIRYELEKYPDLIEYLRNTKTNKYGGTLLMQIGDRGGTSKEQDKSAAIWKNFMKNEKGNITLIPESREKFDKMYETTLKQMFNSGNANIKKFVDEVETMNDVFNRVGISLYMPNAGNTEATGWANATWVKDHIGRQRGETLSEHKEWRNVRYGTEAEEKFDKDTFFREMEVEYAKLKEDNKVGGMDVNEWIDKQFTDRYFKGIRLDIDNPDNPFVAHYELSKGRNVEHNVSLSRSDAVNYFGIPAVYYSLGVELATGLKENDRMYADFDGMANNKKIRLHQNLIGTPTSTIGSGSQAMKKGQFYLLYDEKLGENDPNIGSPDYHPAQKGVKRKVFQSYNQYFRWFQNQNSSEIAVLSTLKRQKDALMQFRNPRYIFEPDHQFIKNKLTYDEIIQEIDKAIGKVAGGNFKIPSNAKSLNDYTTAGVVRENTKTNNEGKEEIYYNVNPQTLEQMNNEDKKNLVFTIRPDLRKVKWYKGDDDQDYSINPSELVSFENSDILTPGYKTTKMYFGPEVGGFFNELSTLVNNFKSKGNTKGDFTTLNPIIEGELITIPSGLRSMQDNLRVYNAQGSGNIMNFTNSNHMAGKSADIRTEEGNTNYKGGKALLEFIQTKAGQDLLRKHGLGAWYHQIQGDQYHIDISTAYTPGKVLYGNNKKDVTIKTKRT